MNENNVYVACSMYLGMLESKLAMLRNQARGIELSCSYSSLVANYNVAELSEEKRWGVVHQQQKMLSAIQEHILKMDAQLKRAEAEFEIKKIFLE